MRHPALLPILFAIGLGLPILRGAALAASPEGAATPASLSITRAALLLQESDGTYNAKKYWVLDSGADHIPGIEGPRVLAGQIEFPSSSGVRTCRFTDNQAPEINDTFTEATTLRLNCNGTLVKIFHRQPKELELYRQAIQTMLTLGTASSEAEDRQFDAALSAFQSGSAGPTIGEAVRVHKVVAENAVRERRLWEAVDAFQQGLALAPWWPQGNFNLALIYAELQAYPLAVRHMRRYLRLVPDAANLRTAQDKIYLWQAEAARAGRGR